MVRPAALLALLPLVTVLGCDAEDVDMNEDASSGAGGSDPTIGDDELGWTLTYTGARSGVLTGDMYSVSNANDFITVSGFDVEGNSFEAPLGEAIGASGDIDSLGFTVRFGSDDECSQDNADPVRVSLIATADTDMFAMSFQGTVECDDGQIQVDGQLRNY